MEGTDDQDSQEGPLESSRFKDIGPVLVLALLCEYSLKARLLLRHAKMSENLTLELT